MKVVAALVTLLAFVGGGIALGVTGDDSSGGGSSLYDYPYDYSGTDYSTDSSSDYSYDYSSSDYSYDYSGSDYSYDSDDGVIGTWSGSASDDSDSSSEDVALDVVSYDGYDDGTLETWLGDSHCSADLAFQETSDSEKVFEASDSDGGCASTVRLEYDSSDDTLWFAESWEDDNGDTVTYSGYLDRE